MVTTTAAAAVPAKGGLLGHAAGLAYLVFTEAWERVSIYGIQALLVLGRALHHGPPP